MNYEEKLKLAKEALASGSYDKETIEYIFPELRESEDEKIRKEIIKLVQFYYGSSLVCKHTVSMDDMVSWLEKQGNVKCSYYPYVPGWRENRPDNKPKIKHSILMLTTHGVTEGEWLGEEWCQYRWSCKVKDTEVLYWLHLSDLETLEKENVKQGEQESSDKVEPKFKVGDTIVEKDLDEYDYKTIRDIKNGQYIFTDGYYMNIDEQEVWQLIKPPTIIEQKPA